MSARIGVRELRQHASRYIELVKHGERVEITERGRLVAVLAPPDPEAAVREHMIASGRLRPGSNGGLAGWVPPIELSGGAETPSAALMRMREAEREDGQE